MSLAFTSPFSSPRGVSHAVWTETTVCPGPKSSMKRNKSMLHFVGDKLANRPRKKPLVNSVYAASLPLILTPTFLSSRHHLFVFSFVCLFAFAQHPTFTALLSFWYRGFVTKTNWLNCGKFNLKHFATVLLHCRLHKSVLHKENYTSCSINFQVPVCIDFLQLTYICVRNSVLKHSIQPQVPIKRLHSPHFSPRDCILHNGHFMRRKELEPRNIVVFISDVDSDLVKQSSVNNRPS